MATFIGLSSEIFNFTKTAGSTAAASYYGGLMESLNDYNHTKKKNPPNTAKMNEAKEGIVEFSQALLEKTTKLVASCKNLRITVDKFSSGTYKTWALLNAKLIDIKQRLSPVEVKHLPTIKGLQKTSSDQLVEYHYGTFS